MTDEDRQVLALEKLKLFRAQNGSAAPLPEEIAGLLFNKRRPSMRRPMTVGLLVTAVVAMALVALTALGLRDSTKASDQATLELNKAIEDADQSLAEVDRLLEPAPNAR